MTFNDLIKTSTKSIAKNKGRTALTSLGIIIGVTSVILLKSIGSGLENYVTSQFESLGSNLVYIVPGKIFNDQGGFNRGGGGSFLTTKFTQKDINNLTRDLRTVKAVIPLTQYNTKIKYSQNEKDVPVIGTTDKYGPVLNSIPNQYNGRWFTTEEVSKKSSVAVLGFQLAKDLFPNNNYLGKKVIVKGKNLQVIGVVDKKGGGFGGPNFDDMAFIPISVSYDLIGSEDVQEIILQAKNTDEVNNAIDQAKKILGQKYDSDAFSVVDQTQILSSINSIIGTLTIALSGIAAISLVVGGIGIMNIMLVTVTERTREIGLRKAVGGTPNVILIQFLTEAIILSCLGGISGIILGYLGTYAISKFFPAQVTVDSIMLAFFVSVGVGVVFGVAPARKASKLSPIEALRYE